MNQKEGIKKIKAGSSLRFMVYLQSLVYLKYCLMIFLSYRQGRKRCTFKEKDFRIFP